MSVSNKAYEEKFERLKRSVEALETYKTALEEHKWWEKKQINTLFLQNAGLKSEANVWSMQIDRAEKNLQQFKSDTRTEMAAMEARLSQRITNLNDKVDATLIEKAEIKAETATKKRWWGSAAEMPPETHTLHALLAQLARPATQ